MRRVEAFRELLTIIVGIFGYIRKVLDCVCENIWGALCTERIDLSVINTEELWLGQEDIGLGL